MSVLTKKAEWESAIAKYPDVPPLILLKLSLRLNGAVLSPAALDAVQNETYSFGFQQNLSMKSELPATNKARPGSILLRDGTNVSVSFEEYFQNPYKIDWDGSSFLLLDGDQLVDTIDFVPRPNYFGIQTSRGVPMDAIASCRAQTLGFSTYQHCHLWDTGNQCKYCMFFTDVRDTRKAITHANTEAGIKSNELDPEDAYETVRYALQQSGRFSVITLTGGMDYSGEEMFDNEVNRYIRILQAIGRNFKGRFPSYLQAPAYSKQQVKRIYEETGLTCYAPNIEVWDEEISKWICPGKHRWPGHKEWIRRTVDAVEIFGKGNVYTQVVAGAELAKPYGFKTVEEALESNFKACEFFSKNGVVFVATAWRPHNATGLGKQESPPLDYYIRLSRGLYEIRKEYGLSADNDDYKRCGNHADTDMERGDSF